MNYQALMTALTDLGFNVGRAITDRSPTEHSFHKRVTVRTAKGEAIYSPSINVSPEKAKDEELPDYTLFFEVYFHRGHSGRIWSSNQKTIKIQDAGWVEAIKAWVPIAVEAAKAIDEEELANRARHDANYASQGEMVDAVKAAFPTLSPQAVSDGVKACGISVNLCIMGTPAEVIEKLRVVMAQATMRLKPTAEALNPPVT